jgi:hypothetical protein
MRRSAALAREVEPETPQWREGSLHNPVFGLESMAGALSGGSATAQKKRPVAGPFFSFTG